MSELSEAVVLGLAELGWAAHPQPVDAEGEHHLLLEPEGVQLGHPVVAAVHDEPGVVVLYSLAPFDVPEPEREAAASYVAMANHGLLLGNFELDLADGEVRFKTSFRATDPAGCTEQLRELLMFNLAAFGAYLPSLATVAAGERTPAEAIADAEQSLG